MNKEIKKIMKGIIDKEELKEAMMVSATDHCESLDKKDIEKRNDLFMFLGTSLALLKFKGVITLNKEKEYKSLKKAINHVENNQNKVNKNEALSDLIEKIVRNEVKEGGSDVEHHMFLVNSLALLKSRNIIKIHDKYNDKEIY